MTIILVLLAQDHIAMDDERIRIQTQVFYISNSKFIYMNKNLFMQIRNMTESEFM